MDVETDAYNTYASLSGMKLYHRLDDLVDDWVPSDVGEYPGCVDHQPIDLLTFDGRDVPTKRQHLIWDGYKLRWRKYLPDRPWKQKPAWADDPFSGEVPYWRQYYGEHFQEYVREGNALVPA